MDDHTYQFITHFWWLVFPLFWMVATVAAHWSRHRRANRVLDLVKSYVDQGKEPPPELLKVLQSPFGHGRDGWREERRYYRRHRHGWVGVFIFAALACWFATMAFTRWTNMPWPHHEMGLLLIALIFAALAVGNMVAAFASRHDDDVLPPK